MTPSLEGWSTKAKEAPSPHKARLAPLDNNVLGKNLALMSFWMLIGLHIWGGGGGGVH